MEGKNRLRISYRDNPELAAILEGKQPGDVFPLTLTLATAANADETFEGTINEIFDAEGGEEPIEPGFEDSVTAVLLPADPLEDLEEE